jgi:hypothetical protein
LKKNDFLSPRKAMPESPSKNFPESPCSISGSKNKGKNFRKKGESDIKHLKKIEKLERFKALLEKN